MSKGNLTRVVNLLHLVHPEKEQLALMTDCGCFSHTLNRIKCSHRHTIFAGI